nr:hypothetical protein BC332_29198 [Ipomoea batatas]GMD73574.1 hypothetical protein BC332_29198 [Ipomoea batatas]GME01150.1 hypothetical protein BC332_29198 [Ipomoea batatas]
MSTSMVLQMSKLVFIWCILVCAVLLHETTVAIRDVPTTTSSPSRATEDSVGGSAEYVTLKPHLRNKGPLFHGKEIKNCLPKGFRHASAPSRYVNYHIFGSLDCSPDTHRANKP